MTLNVRKHESEILSAYNEVLNSSDNQKWLILDYEGNSNVLKIGEKGDDGIEELSMSFNSGKLQYGIASIKSAASSQPKMILIQWQGEGVPTSRLAVTTSHANDLKRFLRGIHVVIIARSEDDVDKESILKVVAKLPTMNDLRGIGGSSEATDKDSQRQGPIGSVYTPIKPNRDIDLSERDKFWRNIETEEANRQLAEQRRATEKAAEADRDRDELTKQIHQKLDINGDHVEARETSRLNSIAHQNTVQKRVMDFGGGDGQRANAHSSSSSPPPTSLGDSLIRGRKAMFEQKANELRNEQSLSPHPTKSRQPKSSVSPPINAQSSINKPSAQFVSSSPSFRTEIGSSSQSSTANHRNVPQQNQSNPVPPLPSSSSPSNPSDHATSYIPSPKMQTPPSNENSSNQPKAGYSNAVMNELKSALPAANQSATTIPSYDMANQSTDDQQKHSQPQQPSSYYEEPPLDEENEQNYATEQHTDLRAIALWDYQAADDTEITFDPDDIITEIEQIDEGWWRGRGPDGTVGLFPANYVSIL